MVWTSCSWEQGSAMLCGSDRVLAVQAPDVCVRPVGLAGPRCPCKAGRGLFVAALAAVAYLSPSVFCRKKCVRLSAVLGQAPVSNGRVRARPRRGVCVCVYVRTRTRIAAL